MTIGRAPYNNKEEMWHTFTWGYEGSKGLVFINQPRIRVCLTSHSVVVVVMPFSEARKPGNGLAFSGWVWLGLPCKPSCEAGLCLVYCRAPEQFTYGHLRPVRLLLGHIFQGQQP